MPVLLAVTAFGVLVVMAWANGGRLPLSPRLESAPPAVRTIAETIAGSAESSAKALLPLERYLRSVQATSTYPHIVPTAGQTVRAKPVTFTFEGVRHTIAPTVDSSVYWGAKAASRDALVSAGTSAEEWSAAYYKSIALDPAQSAMIDSACSQLRAIAKSEKLSSDEYLELIAKYVQSITYDKKAYASGKAVVRFPVQLVVDGKGLCEDKSLYLVALLSHEGYATALLSYVPENHMAVGVKGPGATYGNTGYLFLETTAPSYVSEVPALYEGGMRLTSEPQVVPVGDGTKTYGSANQVAKIVAARDTAAAAAASLYASAKSRQLTYAQAEAINAKLAIAQKATTSLRSNVVDENGKSVGRFMDRAQAYRWVRLNAWWD